MKTHYLIDGYNLFFVYSRKINPLSEKREHFIEILNEGMRSADMFGSVIFDSNKDVANFYPSNFPKTNIDVIFSPAGIDADGYILEYIETLTRRDHIILISCDKALAYSAKMLGVKAIGVKDFFEKITRRKRKKNPPSNEKPASDCDHQIARLLEIFEKLDNN